jgi:hypothetical protein
MEYETNTKIGTIETEKLKPLKVIIQSASIVEVGEKKNPKLSCYVKHPDSPDFIQISSAKIEIDNKLKIAGLWFNLDADKNIKSLSALAKLMRFLKAGTVKELEGKEINTILDDRGYLCFKGY